MSFSNIHGYNKKPKLIFEDAPIVVRKHFQKHILDKLVIRSKYAFGETLMGPINMEDLLRDLYFYIGDESDVPPFAGNSTTYLTHLINRCEWFHFYDIIERIGQNLLFTYKGKKPDLKYSFITYRNNVNEMFEHFNIGFRITEESKIEKLLPKSISEKENHILFNLEDRYAPAKIHFEKAINFIKKVPIDPQNSIKEIVSAVESVGKIQYTGSRTLGDVINNMKKEGIRPKLLLSLMEKYYAFASDEPGVRHGGNSTSTVGIVEAELCIHIGMAFIRYMLDGAAEWMNVE